MEGAQPKSLKRSPYTYYTMGKVQPDLDQRLGRIHQQYLFAKSHGDYETAADFLYELNTTCPQEARLTDMKPFKPRLESTRDKLMVQVQARDYCRRYNGLINSLITDKVIFAVTSYGAGD